MNARGASTRPERDLRRRRENAVDARVRHFLCPIQPFDGRVRPFSCSLQPFDGRVPPFDGPIKAFCCIIEPFDRRVQAFSCPGQTLEASKKRPDTSIRTSDVRARAATRTLAAVFECAGAPSFCRLPHRYRQTRFCGRTNPIVTCVP